MSDTPGYHDNKAAYLARLRRIEGQVRGLQRLVDEDTYCIDILTQVSAVNKALQGVAVGLVGDHLGHCVRDAVASGGSEADEKVAEASAAIARLLRT
jgi:DNA-binding FrmR family transcriptional regulator